MREGMKRFYRKSLVHLPDFVEGLDILVALGGTNGLLLDMYDHPCHVHRFQRALLELYFEYCDRCYEITRDQTGGSCFWVWAPGRLAKLQCDFSAMISPAMFDEYLVPYLSKPVPASGLLLLPLGRPASDSSPRSIIGHPRLGWHPMDSGSRKYRCRFSRMVSDVPKDPEKRKTAFTSQCG